MLSGRGGNNGAVGVSNGQVVLDLAPLEAVAKQDLVARGLTIAGKIPIVHATFALFPSKNLTKAQSAYRLINDLKIVLPIATLVLLGLGVLAARGHRRALIGAGLGFAASMLVLGAGLAIARVLYLNSVPASASAAAAAAAFDILVRFIRTALRTLLVVGLIVAIGAFFTGPSTAAVATRSAFSSGLGRLRRGGESRGLSTGPVGRWTYAHRHALRIAAVALAALIFVFWGRPTAAVTIVIAALLLVVLGLIELIGRPPPQPAPHPPPPAGDTWPPHGNKGPDDPSGLGGGEGLRSARTAVARRRPGACGGSRRFAARSPRLPVTSMAAGSMLSVMKLAASAPAVSARVVSRISASSSGERPNAVSVSRPPRCRRRPGRALALPPRASGLAGWGRCSRPARSSRW